MDELEFRTLRRRLLGEEAVVEQPTTIPEAKKATVNAGKAKASSGQLDLFGSIVEEKKLELFDETDTPSESNPKATIDSTVHQYHLIDTPELRQSLIHFLSLQDEICFDTETTNVDAVEADLVGLSFAYRAGEAYYVPTPANREETQAIVDEFKTDFCQ